MSTTIDSKVVEMRFDNKNFESNVATTMSTLDRLKQCLNFKGSAKGLDDVASSAGRVNGPMSGIASAVETVRSKFSALEVMGVTALANITNSAVNAGKRIVSALTIEPIKMGFQEYETQMNAVQTIMANTSSKGTTLKDVNSALDELNTYADKTIYNFTEMTRNIGTFTAAGVDLDTSVSAIKGIANLAAVSGSTSQQASTAMYQLSQALANGKVNLQDWNSVVNAGMGGEVFQNALKRTAKNMGTDVDALIKKYGSFRESLTKGEWLTTDVLTKTLEQFTMAAKEGSKEWENYKKALMKEGYTEKQATEILKMANTATDAATKVKTLTQLWDTLKEAAQSGWAQSWKIIVGDFEEAKALFTEISDTLGKIIGDSAESRNKVLQGWKDMGGRTALVDSLKNAFEGVMSVVKPIGEAFREIFPPVTAKTLYNLTQNLKKFTEGLKLSGETSDKVKRIFKGLFSIVDIVRKVITTATKALFGLSQSDGIGSLADFVLDTAAAIGDFFTSMNKNFDGKGLFGIFSTIGSGISGLLKGVTGGLSGLGGALSSAGKWIVDTAKKIWEPIKKVFSWIKENVSIGDIFAGLAGGGVFAAAKKFSGVFDTIKDSVEKFFDGVTLKDLKETFTDVLDSVKDSLQAFTTGIKVWSLVGIAVAVGILAHSLRTLSELKAVDIGKSLLGIGIGLSILTGGFKSMTKSLTRFDSGGIVKSAFSLILIAKALDILADVMAKMGKLSLAEIGKGLAGIGGGLLELSGALKIIGTTKVPLSTSVAVLALAYSCDILGDALKKFSGLSWGEIRRGLTAMGGALGELVAAVSILGKFGGGGSLLGSIGIFITVKSLDDLASALDKFGQMAWGEIRRGLTAMGGALLEVGAVLSAVGKIAGFSSIFAAGAIWAVIQGLDDLASALDKFGTMAWGEIRRGLTGMGGALAEVGIVTGTLGKLAGFSGLFGAGSILITIQGLEDLATALDKFGAMSWGEIRRGLTGMGGALLEVAGMSGALGKLAGFSGIFGSGSILIAVQGLDDLANAFKKFGEMSWSEIGRGLAGMGGALIEVGGITGALGYLTNFAGLLGSASIWTAVQGLGDLADAFKKFGEMSWDEIGRGLAAMGGALAELAVGGALNTLSIIGSYSISEVAEPLGVLADSVKKWAGVTVPEGLGIQLSSLAYGVKSFTFGGSGASAIATMAEPLGVLAGSVTKWTNVTVPEGLGEQLNILADAVSAFTFSGLGASAISSVGAPLGQLADSVNKWANVKVPENLNEQLTGLAGGIKAFSWAFVGGWSISSIIQPLSQLPDAISKWTNITVPTGIEDGLTSIANGIKSFTLLDAIKLQMIDDNIVTLGNALKGLSGVTVDSGTIKDNLSAIADGIGEFSLLDVGKLQTVDDNILSLSNAFKNFSNTNFDGTKITTFATKLKDCATKLKDLDTGSIDTAKSSVNKIVDIMKKINSTKTGNVSSFVTAANSLNNIDISKINVDTTNLSSAVKAIKDTMASISKTISSSKDSISTAMKTAMSGTSKAITDKKADITSEAKKLSDAAAKAITDKKKTVTNAFKTLVSGGASAIRDKYQSFYSAGSYLVSGFANGISANSYKAAAKAKAMAEAAIKAAREALAINSPSKVFRAIGAGVPEGFAQGIAKLGNLVSGATRGMTDTAVSSTRRAISKLADIVTGNIDTQPTIKPVVDLSNVRAGAAAVSGMFSANPSVGLLTNIGSINSMMNRRNQNGLNDDVVSAIKDLKKALGNVSGDTYTFGNITYGDDSAVSDAVQSLVRAIRVERRT